MQGNFLDDPDQSECKHGGDAERHDEDDFPFGYRSCRNPFDLPRQNVQIGLGNRDDESERQTGTGQEKEVGGLGKRPPHRFSDHADAEIDAVQKNRKASGDAEGAQQKALQLQGGQRRQGGVQQQDDCDDGEDCMQHFPDF
ncbi:hypothetical protein SDC9_133216 [bioreactor metagenome]|uniref:Uncharacterized protein n=1 Tax=bioreactor metagenome TaxID=1076179 RepID=A0A645DB32_9ZZZZ